MRMKRKIYVRSINVVSIAAIALILVANYFNSGAIAWWTLSGAALLAIVSVFGYFALHWQSMNDNESVVAEETRGDAASNAAIKDSQTTAITGKFEASHAWKLTDENMAVFMAIIEETESLEFFPRDLSIVRISPSGTVFVKGKTPAPGKAKYSRDPKYVVEKSATSRGSGDISQAGWRESPRRGYVH